MLLRAMRQRNMIADIGAKWPADRWRQIARHGVVRDGSGISRRAYAHVALSDLGMVQSTAGFMGIGRARPAAWSTASFNTAEQKMTWTKVNRSAKLIPYVLFGLFALRVLFQLFGHRS